MNHLTMPKDFYGGALRPLTKLKVLISSMAKGYLTGISSLKFREKHIKKQRVKSQSIIIIVIKKISH